MNLPNKLTISRIILTFIFMVFLFTEGVLAKCMALLIFSIASLTDLYDGRIARRENLVTNFGKLMDPIADKILVLAAFLAFVQLGIVRAWMVVLIIARELVITGLRILAVSNGKVLAAERGGKHKLVSQFTSIYVILSFLALRDTGKFHQAWSHSIENYFKTGIYLLMLITVTFTLISGGSYVWRNKELLTQKRKGRGSSKKIAKGS